MNTYVYRFQNIKTQQKLTITTVNAINLISAFTTRRQLHKIKQQLKN